MPIHNREIATKFERLADLLEIEGANPFRVRAYRNAARTIVDSTHSMADLVKREADLSELPNIGKDLAEKIKTIVETGQLPLLQQVEKRTPKALSELMKIEGLGPKKVQKLYKQLKINSIDDLRQAAEKGKIQKLSGFGKKTEDTIKSRVEHFHGEERRTKLIDAEDIAEPLLAYLEKSKGIKKIIIAGSYRRRKETVGDLDILVTAKKDSNVIGRFSRYDEVEEIISQGTTRSTVHLRSGISVDLRVVPQVSYGAALLYFTGSKAHNIALRKIAVKKKFKMNEYGLFRGKKRLASKTEKAVYEKLGLQYIEPELRENRGEIEAAKKSKNKLPNLITLTDIRGDLHCHTKATDGHHTLTEMADAAKKLGHDYLAITEHSKHLTVAKGLDKNGLLKHIDAIDKLNDKLRDFTLLKSIEVDILEDGKLDLPDDVLKQLDLVVCSVHYQFNLSRKKQTDRVLTALDNPYVNILAHPTTRLINQREAYDIDLEKIMQRARKNGCFLELNAHPDRLDLTDDACKMAKGMGLKLAVSTDAHSTHGLEFMRFGIDQARRGWLEKKHVINTRSLTQLRKLLKR